jgi:hypothetical protein
MTRVRTDRSPRPEPVSATREKRPVTRRTLHLEEVPA